MKKATKYSHSILDCETHMITLFQDKKECMVLLQEERVVNVQTLAYMYDPIGHGLRFLPHRDPTNQSSPSNCLPARGL
jgi:hypothetical protein